MPESDRAPRALARGLRRLGWQYPRDLAVGPWGIADRSLRRVPVLTYHRLEPPQGRRREDRLRVAPSAFAEQMAYLARHGYETVFASELVAALREGRALPARPAVVTFDDGFESLLEHGAPVLEAHGQKATVLLITERHRAARPGYLRREQIAALGATGRFEFGSHGVRHLRLPSLAPGEQRAELEQSKREIEDWLGRESAVFCYPFGARDRRSAGLVGEAGYRGALGNSRGLLHARATVFSLSRIPARSEPIGRFGERLRSFGSGARWRRAS